MVGGPTPETSEAPGANPFDSAAAAKRYFDYWSTRLGRAVFAIEFRALRDLADLSPPARLLDLGCGSGHFAVALARAGFEVTAADASEAMLREARDGHGGDARSVHWVRADMELLPFPDCSFDCVVQLVSLEFAHDWRAAIGEVKRVVRPGGIYMVGLASHNCLFSAMKPSRRHLIEEVAVGDMAEALGWGAPDGQRAVVRIPPLALPYPEAIAPLLDGLFGRLGFGGAVCFYRFKQTCFNQ